MSYGFYFCFQVQLFLSVVSSDLKAKVEIESREKLFIKADAIITSNRGFLVTFQISSPVWVSILLVAFFFGGNFVCCSVFMSWLPTMPRSDFYTFFVSFYKFIIPFFHVYCCQLSSSNTLCVLYKKELTKMRHKRHTFISLYRKHNINTIK